MDHGTIYKKIFPGATVDEVNHYCETVLQDNTIDTVILQIGGNNVNNKHAPSKTDVEIVSSIIKIVDKCHLAGVNDVYVSGITCRYGHKDRIDTINDLQKLSDETTSFKYTYICNDNIVANQHLNRDGIHLNSVGINILTNNFINALSNGFNTN